MIGFRLTKKPHHEDQPRAAWPGVMSARISVPGLRAEYNSQGGMRSSLMSRMLSCLSWALLWLKQFPP